MHHRLVPALLATVLSASAASAQSIVRSFAGSTANLHVGSAIDYLSDLNGDGYEDMVVGAPNPSGQGAIYWVSGKYLQTGTGFSTLGATIGASLAGFGQSVVGVGDVTGDGVEDVLVGQDESAGSGVIHQLALVSGASKAKVAVADGSVFFTFGNRLERFSDYDGDGYQDVLVSSGGGLGGFERVQICSPRKIFTGSSPWLGFVEEPSAIEFGASFSAGDLDGDGKKELVVGAPGTSNDAGRLYVFSGTSLALVNTLNGSASSRLGESIDATRDLDGDGYCDIVAGAPNSVASALEGGEVIVYSGHRVALVSPPYDLVHWSSSQAYAHFGASVCAQPDMNGDFRSDLAVGAPGIDVLPPLFSNNGAVYLYSGDTFESMGIVTGSNGDFLGATVSRAWDYTGDIRWEIAVGGPDSDASASDGGVMRIVSVFPNAPTTYCTPKVNSLGCTPSISFTGSPSASSSSPFLIKATNVLNKKNGLLFYGYDANGAPFQGGTMCAKAPIKRTSVQSTGGSSTGSDCTGAMSFDFNAYLQSGADPAIALQGAEVFCQYWSRDPNSASTTSLTNALRFVVNP
ncbi:MAG: FG-GAP repeat protein [Planctomycetes bacterium]|nr:FG-GAP repeat protein [Planctomycetota bacterium]